MLAYIGEKIYSWSDPSLVDPKDILDTVALYYPVGFIRFVSPHI